LAYDFVIIHLEPSKDWTAGPSRRPDYDIGYERPVAQLMATVSVESYDDLIPAIIVTQAFDPLAVDVSENVVDRSMTDGTDTDKKESQ